MNDLRSELLDLFSEFAGHPADGLWSAPGRANLIGEYTDFNEGYVLPFAIDRRTLVALGTRDDGIIRVASTFSDEVVEVPLADLAAAQSEGLLQGWAAYPLGVAWALLAHDPAAARGADLLVDSTVPVGAGLSSSAAIECAVALALAETWGLELTRQQLALVGQRAENDAVGAPTGIMDQSASLLGTADSALFLDCRSLESAAVPLGFERAGLTIAVIDTGVKHAHSTGGYRDRRASCEAGAAALGVSALRDVTLEQLDAARDRLDGTTFRRVRHVVTENQRVLDTVRELEAEGPYAIGALLDASHRSLRDDFEVSVPELDLAVETALENGAIGARMTGGGFGGSAIALIPVDDLSRLQVAIDGAFSEHGFAVPVTFPVRPSDGARREH